MENRTPGRRSCRKTRSGWKIGGLEGVVAQKLYRSCSCRETISGWKIGRVEGVVEEKLYLDGK